MAKNCKWNREDLGTGEDLRVVLFTSRNKDNPDILGFKERRRAYLATCDGYELSNKVRNDFWSFVRGGVDHELCRVYISVNKRDSDKTYKALLHYLIDNPDIKLTAMPSKLAAIAAKKENAAERKWLFDFDDKNYNSLVEFCRDITDISGAKPETYTTPHGFAVICEHGFDMRLFPDKWKDIATLKRDDLLCRFWMRKPETDDGYME